MVLIKIKNKGIVIASGDSIIKCNSEKSTDHHVRIAEPTPADNLTKGQIDVIKKDVRTITSLEYSKNGEYIVVSTENKQVLVYDEHSNVVKNFLVNRTASKVCFTPTNDILVADKTGDVYLYRFTSETNKPELLLGHLSVILDMVLSDCGKYIITCDRDEKIRVSHFPNCYNIASYCLGHTEFVTSIKLYKNVLISASGDGSVRFWDFVAGKQLGLINTNEHTDSQEMIEFSQEMDKDKVDVSALPVTGLQVHYNDDKLCVAVSVYPCKSIQLYSVDLSNFQSNFITKLTVSTVLGFCYTNNTLYILSNQLSCFELSNNQLVENDSPILQSLYEKYADILSQTNGESVTGLYKRKFDNVQEYLERKKQRLEGIKH